MQEYGEPIILLQNAASLFYSLVEQTGPLVAADLIDIAKKVW